MLFRVDLLIEGSVISIVRGGGFAAVPRRDPLRIADCAARSPPVIAAVRLRTLGGGVGAVRSGDSRRWPRATSAPWSRPG